MNGEVRTVVEGSFPIEADGLTVGDLRAIVQQLDQVKIPDDQLLELRDNQGKLISTPPIRQIRFRYPMPIPKNWRSEAD